MAIGLFIEIQGDVVGVVAGAIAIQKEPYPGGGLQSIVRKTVGIAILERIPIANFVPIGQKLGRLRCLKLDRVMAGCRGPSANGQQKGPLTAAVIRLIRDHPKVAT